MGNYYNFGLKFKTVITNYNFNHLKKNSKSELPTTILWSGYSYDKSQWFENYFENPITLWNFCFNFKVTIFAQNYGKKEWQEIPKSVMVIHDIIVFQKKKMIFPYAIGFLKNFNHYLFWRGLLSCQATNSITQNPRKALF